MKHNLLNEHTEKVEAYIELVERVYITLLNEISKGIELLEVGPVTKELIIGEVTGKEVAQSIHDKRVEKEILETPSLKSDIVRTSNKTSRVLWGALNTIKHKTMGVAYIQHTGNAKEEVAMNHINNLNDPKLFEWFDVDEKGVCYLNGTAKEQLNDYFLVRK